jgi:hypothetical protein
MSKKTSIRQKLQDTYCIYFTRNELYKAMCSFNDRMGRVYTISELESLLDGKNDLLQEFSDFLLDEFEPEHKFVA